jgi:hypothetical protein
VDCAAKAMKRSAKGIKQEAEFEQKDANLTPIQKFAKTVPFMKLRQIPISQREEWLKSEAVKSGYKI